MREWIYRTTGLLPPFVWALLLIALVIYYQADVTIILSLSKAYIQIFHIPGLYPDKIAANILRSKYYFWILCLVVYLLCLVLRNLASTSVHQNESYLGTLRRAFSPWRSIN